MASHTTSLPAARLRRKSVVAERSAHDVLRKPASAELVTLGALAESGLVKIGKSYA